MRDRGGAARAAAGGDGGGRRRLAFDRVQPGKWANSVRAVAVKRATWGPFGICLGCMWLKALIVGFSREATIGMAGMMGMATYFGPEHFLVSLPVLVVLSLAMWHVQRKGLKPLGYVMVPLLMAGVMVYSCLFHPGPIYSTGKFPPHWKVAMVYRQELQEGRGLEGGATAADHHRRQLEEVRDQMARENYLYDASIDLGRIDNSKGLGSISTGPPVADGRRY